jgi:Holliday junction resolvase RusA-like endonuclease
MTKIFHNREYRVVVPGKAESFRMASAREYKEKVRKIASNVFTKVIPHKKVEMRINYFHPEERRMDMDNVAKCIMDALIGIAYKDDRQVSLQQSSSHFLKKTFRIDNEPVDIVKPLEQFNEYVIVRIREVDQDKGK